LKFAAILPFSFSHDGRQKTSAKSKSIAMKKLFLVKIFTSTSVPTAIGTEAQGEVKN